MWRHSVRAGLCLLLCGAVAGPAAAHPLDETVVYHYLWLEARPGEVALQHATVVGGRLAPDAWKEMDGDGDGKLSPAEQKRDAEQRLGAISLRVAGRPTRWKLAERQYPARAEFLSGAFPIVTLKLVAPLPAIPAEGLTFGIRDGTYPNYTAVFPAPAVRPFRLIAGDPEMTENGRQVFITLRPGTGNAGATTSPPAGGPTGRTDSGRPPPESGKPPNWFRDLAPPDPGKLMGGGGRILYSRPDAAGPRSSGTSHAPGTPGEALPHSLIVLLLGLALGCGARRKQPTAAPPSPAGRMPALPEGQQAGQAEEVDPRPTAPVPPPPGIVSRMYGAILQVLSDASGAVVLAAVLLVAAPRLESEPARHSLWLFGALGVIGLGFWLFLQGILLAVTVPPPAPAPARTAPAHGPPQDYPLDEILSPPEPIAAIESATRWRPRPADPPPGAGEAVVVGTLGGLALGGGAIGGLLTALALTGVIAGLLAKWPRSPLRRVALPATAALVFFWGIWLTVRTVMRS